MERISVLGRLAIFVLFVDVSICAAGETWKAGVATVDITPNERLWMAGYASRDHPAEGTLAKLFAKVLVLEDENENRACLIAADLIGVSGRFTKLVCHEMRARYGLQRAQIAICTSHTHTGPVVGENLDALHLLQLNTEQQQDVSRYTGILQGKILNAVHTAVNSMQPCTLGWGSGRSTFAVNRRENRPEANVPAQRTNGTLKGPVDHDVPVLAVRDPEGKLISVVFGYACHATVLSFYQWSADYPGFAQTDLEKLHPGCVAIFWAGCGADQNPLPRRKVELAQHYGRRLANAVDAVLLTTEMQPVSSQLATHFKEIDLSFSHIPDRPEVEMDAMSKDRYIAARAKKFLKLMDDGIEIRKTYPYPISYWKLGKELRFIMLGGEVVVDFAIRIKAEQSGTKTWVAGYCNDVMAYIPSRRVLREGGYEGGGAMVYYGLPSPWAPDVEERIVGQVKLMSGLNQDN